MAAFRFVGETLLICVVVPVELAVSLTFAMPPT